MGVTNKYASPDIRAVDLYHPTITAARFLYAFPGKVDQAEITVLQQTPIATAIQGNAAPVIAGTSSSKPTPLIVRRKATPVITTLCSTTAYEEAYAQGWRRSETAAFNSKRAQDTNVDGYSANVTGAIMVCVEVESKGKPLKWGWWMPKSQAKKIGSAGLTALGIEIPSTVEDFAQIVLGCNSVKPPRAKKVITEGATDGMDTTTTFYSTKVENLPDDWTHVKNYTDYEA
ncbi:MAG: hypothetical protein F6K54_16170 [Okeania sp. SIO3B5]|uniref:hypothetical protein n=1 Tax=Okeania sp. SIO3B5 TaxID=2607811 RepID=UPI0013FFC23A|nr:hypothetical protein [Okeania sp. SIO3B5]NEO54480.1 hypothetical protein [Okeania sp. SIO3B5]